MRLLVEVEVEVEVALPRDLAIACLHTSVRQSSLESLSIDLPNPTRDILQGWSSILLQHSYIEVIDEGRLAQHTTLTDLSSSL